MVHATTTLAYPKWPCVCLKINMCFIYGMTSSFLNLLCLFVCHMTCNHYCDHVMWYDCHSNPLLSSKNGKRSINQKENENRKEKKRRMNEVHCFQLWHLKLTCINYAIWCHLLLGPSMLFYCIIWLCDFLWPCHVPWNDVMLCLFHLLSTIKNIKRKEKKK